MPSRVNIGRATQTITAAQVSQVVDQFVRERFGWSKESVALHLVTGLEDILVPQGALLIKPSLPNSLVPTDRFFVSVAFEVDGRTARYLNLELDVEATAIVAVVGHGVERGAIVAAGDVGL